MAEEKNNHKSLFLFQKRVPQKKMSEEDAETPEESINEKLIDTGLDAAILENNLSRIAYTLDREYLSHLDGYGVFKFSEYCKVHNIAYKPTPADEAAIVSNVGEFKNFMAIKVTGFIINKDEKVIDCMKNVIGAFSNTTDSLGFIIHRKMDSVDLYFVFKKDGEIKRDYVSGKLKLLKNSLLGNFPGSSSSEISREDIIHKEFLFMENATYISMLSAVPSDKSENYISQGIEKLLNGVIPSKPEEEYTVLMLAQSLTQEEIRDIINGFEEMATAITPYASHQFQIGKNDSESNGEMKSSTDTTGISHAISKTHSINVGINAGGGRTSAAGLNNAVTDSESDTLTEGKSDTEGSSIVDTTGFSESDTTGSSESNTTGSSESNTTGSSESNTTGSSESDTTGSSKSNTEGSSDTAGGSVFASTTGGVTAGGPGISVQASATAGGSIDYHHGWNRSATEAINASKTMAVNTSKTMTINAAKTVTTNIAKTVTTNVAKTVTTNVAKSIGKNIAKTIISSTAKTVGKAVMSGTFSSIAKMLSFGISGGYGYSWGKIDTDSESKSLTDGTNHNITLGTSENTTYTYKSYQVNDLLKNMEANIKRITESKATGLWKIATYVFSQDEDVSSRVAHYLRGLTQGDESFIEAAAVQQWKKEWRDDENGEKKEKENYPFPEIHKYLLHFTHPVFVNRADIDFSMANRFAILDSLREELQNNTEIDNDLKEEAFRQIATSEPPDVPFVPITPTTNISTTELAKIFSLPTHSLPGLPVLECAEFGRNVASYDDAPHTDGRKLELGKVYHMHREESLPVQLDVNSLASHTFITGSTGSGKSNTVYQLLGSLRRQGVTFLVVEPAKGEYKDVFGSEGGVSVYGTNPRLSPLLRINPFSFPKDIHILEHLDRLVEIFNVCWPMYAAMPAVLKEAVEKSYEDAGWNLTESTNDYGELYPTFADVTRNIRTIIDSSEYDAENKGAYKGSLITRLKSLTNGINGLIFTTDEIPSSALFDENVIVDLSRVGSSETKSLIMGLLVLKLQEYRMTAGKMNAPLRHVTVLEEAHNLLKRTSTEQSLDSGNQLGKSVEMLTNAIAEMRTYGEGFIIADQAPGLLDMAVIRNTNTKIILRLPDQSDRELVGRAAALNDDQIAELAKLPCGVAAVYQNDWVQPVLCKVAYFAAGGKRYSYTRPQASVQDPHTADRLEIARLLCNGIALTKEAELCDLKAKLERLNLLGSTKVLVLNFVKFPLESPRYTKLAPVVSELFPAVRSAFVSSFARTSNMEQWTIDVDNAIRAQVQMELDEELCRSIRQCIITGYLHNELGRTELLEKWAKTGGIR